MCLDLEVRKKKDYFIGKLYYIMGLYFNLFKKIKAKDLNKKPKSPISNIFIKIIKKLIKYLSKSKVLLYLLNTTLYIKFIKIILKIY